MTASLTKSTRPGSDSTSCLAALSKRVAKLALVEGSASVMARVKRVKLIIPIFTGGGGGKSCAESKTPAAALARLRLITSRTIQTSSHVLRVAGTAFGGGVAVGAGVRSACCGVPASLCGPGISAGAGWAVACSVDEPCVNRSSVTGWGGVVVLSMVVSVSFQSLWLKMWLLALGSRRALVGRRRVLLRGPVDRGRPGVMGVSRLTRARDLWLVWAAVEAW